MTAAHSQQLTHRYRIFYPAHEPRESDPNYVDFHAYLRRTVNTARCAIAVRYGPAGEGETTAGCHGGLELHHAHIEDALRNGVDLAALEHDYPGVSNPDEVGAWVQSAQNLIYYCVEHHRGISGVHRVAHADFEASQYVPGLIGEAT